MGRSRRAFALVECIILILIVGVTLMALLETVAWSLRLRAFSQTDIDTYLMAQSWFEVLESKSSEDLLLHFDASAEDAGEALGGEIMNGKMMIRGVSLTPSSVRDDGRGVLSVTLNMQKPSAGGSGNPAAEVVFSRDINLFSSETVPDNLRRVR